MTLISRRIVASTVLFFVFMTSTVLAADVACTQCGMIVDADSRFTSKIVNEKATLFFCDIGDLFAYLKKKGQNAVGALVRDYRSGGWIDAQKAFYVHAEKKFKTPMGWGIAAFQDRSLASEYGPVMDYDAVAKALK